MNSIRYLDISELNDRLDELTALRDALDAANEAHNEAVRAFECASRAFSDNSDETQNDDLDAAMESAREEMDEAEEALNEADVAFATEERKELEKLEALKDEIGERRGKIDEGNGPFVHEYDFAEYAQELAEDIGAIDRNVSWPLTCIDWTAAANELRADYTEITWEGASYLYRAY